jgi:hypothetical protein
MVSGNVVYLDPGGVRAAGSSVAAASTTAPARTISVTPCAPDVTSVTVANELALLVGELISATSAANHTAATAAARLAGNATTYEEQEAANAAALRNGSLTRGNAVSVINTPDTPAPVFTPPMVSAAGNTPSTGKEIAALIHQGPGPAGLESAAGLLDTHAGYLDAAADSIRSARHIGEQSWDSAAADLANGHLRRLEASYGRHAARARALSVDARTQADNFRRAKANIPPPQIFEDLEHRLQAANAANTAPGNRGIYTAMVTKLQTELAAANQRAVHGYSAYSTGAQLQAPHLRSPEAAITTGRGNAGRGQEIDTAAEGNDETAAAPLPGIPAPGGPGQPPAQGEGDPAAQVLGPPAMAASELLQAVLPAVLGGVAGAAGGLLGALSGAGEKLQQGLMQGAGQAVSALSTLPGQGTHGIDMTADGARSRGDGLGGPGFDDAGGDGFMPGDTEPASALAGPLASAPASAAAAPAAAPATYSSSVSTPATTVAAPAGVAPMGAMLPPPMMMGAGRGGGGEDDRRLYSEKRLHLQTPPNAEPVKGRREARESHSGRGE